MTNEQAIITLYMIEAHGSLPIQAKEKAIQALKAIEKIKQIVNISNSVIQEDVIKYKMICEVINNETNIMK